MVRAVAVTLLALLAYAPIARAGGGPETTLVVVNAGDPSSLRVAHAYAAGRDIPRSHLLYLDGVPDRPVIDVDTFRERILQPIDAYLEAEQLGDDIELIAYSVGFPYAVAFDAEAKASGVPIKVPVTRNASLTGMTYLYRHVLAKDAKAYLAMDVNRYFRLLKRGAPRPQPRVTPALAAKVKDYRGAIQTKDFRRAETVLDELVEALPGVPSLWYDLACCRAVNGKATEALDALEKAVGAGFTQAEHAEADVDLEGVREKPRFEELLGRMRKNRRTASIQPSRAFSTSEFPYRMAVMLGWTGAHGMTVDEVLQCLERARSADATFPDGTVYFMKNKNVRSKTRAPHFEAVKGVLEGMGRKAQILERDGAGQDGNLPRGKGDSIGVVAGSAGFQWKKTDPLCLPGAIAEHLTSFGAHFGTKSQTKCTEFLKHGAAGTSGTVAEPYALQAKFPTPWIHVHYANGCSLAEAFYQSVWGPYQLLVLGDPLTQPFARFATVKVASPDVGETWAGEVEVRAEVGAADGMEIDRIELWVDGRRLTSAGPDEPLPWDTSTVADGVHDVRVVAVEKSLVATRSYAKAWIRTANQPDLSLEPRALEKDVVYGEPLELRGKVRGVTKIEVLHGGRVLETHEIGKKKAYRFEIATVPLGLGATEIVLRGIATSGRAILSAPLPVETTVPTKLRVARILSQGDALPGLRLVAKTDTKKEIEGIVGTLGQGKGRTFRQDLERLGAKSPKTLRLEGQVRVPAGLADLRVKTQAATRVQIGDETVLDVEAAATPRTHVLLLPLAAGWHDLAIEADGAEAARLEIELGGSRARAPLRGGDLAHLPMKRVRSAKPDRVTAGEGGRGVAIATDGKRGGAKGFDMDPDGLVFQWNDRVKNIEAVVLHAAHGKGAPGFHDQWLVETRTSGKAKWRAVKSAQVVRAAPIDPPPKKGEAPLRYVEVRFKRTSAKELRIRPAADASDKKARLAEVEIFVKG